MRKSGCGETLRKSNEVTVRRSSWIIHCLLWWWRESKLRRGREIYWRRKTLASLWNLILSPRR